MSPSFDNPHTFGAGRSSGPPQLPPLRGFSAEGAGYPGIEEPGFSVNDASGDVGIEAGLGVGDVPGAAAVQEEFDAHWAPAGPAHVARGSTGEPGRPVVVEWFVRDGEDAGPEEHSPRT